MKGGKFSFLGKTLCLFLALWIVLAAPTGWLYDLGVGEGIEQGQRPDGRVQLLRRQEEVETFFWSGAPVTVTGGALTPCPLMRLRDGDQEGTHYRSGPGRRGVHISEYIAGSYPLPTWEKALQSLLGVAYNRYHLIELEDGSQICVYFDDYLTVTEGESYPTGYLRYTTTEERRMLERMAGDYEVDPVYVLDLYRQGKVSWMLELLLRFGALLGGFLLVMALRELWRRTRRDR